MNDFFDNASEFFSKRPGLLPLIGILLVIINFVLNIFPGDSFWVVSSNLFLHLGIIVSIVGILLIKPLQ
ncbi:MAG: hypothetical protein AAF633_24945 [Chloroflexota bacterium]